MKNAVLYTFSTIAQALAGAIALLGAFVLYRLQSLRSQIEQDGARVAAGYGIAVQGYDPEHAKTAQALDREERYSELVVFASRTPLPAGVETNATEYARLRLNLVRKDSLLRTFLVSLLLTVGLIVASVTVLAATPAIIACSRGPAVVLGVGVAWFLGCMISYTVLIRKALK